MASNTSTPLPYGLSFHDKIVNFSLYTKNATSVDLVLEHPKNGSIQKMALSADKNKSGLIWHIALPYSSVKGYFYSYLLDKKIEVLDPYAQVLNAGCHWGEGAKPGKVKGIVLEPETFDWQEVSSPGLKMHELIIYEAHVRGFTQKADVENPGTFLGMIEKIPYLKSLGINAIELMPIHEFNETEYPKVGLFNFWGYSPLSYFAFMQRYATKPAQALTEFKQLVKALHQAGIEIIIDVVYNHTAEGGQSGPVYNLKALDPHYYLLDSNQHLVDYSGCGNTLDANHFPSLHMILESLKFMAIECHVDGFRFDLASTFYRDAKGTLAHPPIINALIEDPILSQKKLIAEAWDARGLYQVGAFPKPFAEWNGAYRDKVRQFLKNDPHSKGAFADAIAGTFSLYQKKCPQDSINFITAHDGFTLRDLVSYNHKHNLANGENNRDGNDANFSYNWGHEGETKDPAILKIRDQIQRAALSILLLSLGTPMLLMGDEYGHTRNGNNNAWCHDNDLNYFQWDKLDNDKIQMIAHLIELRKKIPALKGFHFLDKKEATWHGLKLNDPAWSRDDGYLALQLHPDFFIIFNMSKDNKTVILPEGTWYEVFNSTHSPHQVHGKIEAHHFLIESHSVSVLCQKNL